MSRRRRRLQFDHLETRSLLALSITRFPLPSPELLVAGIAAGPDGKVWFTAVNRDSVGGKLGAIDPTTGTTTEYALPIPNAVPYGITAGPGGNLWFTESVTGQNGDIGAINPTTHAITDYPIPVPYLSGDKITVGSDGNLWFTVLYGGAIGEFNPTTHAFTMFTLPTTATNGGAVSQPRDITSGPDGNIWFTATGPNGAEIGKIDVRTHAVSNDYGLGGFGITTGSDGNLWFTEQFTARIGALNPYTGAVTYYALPERPYDYGPYMTSAPDGNLWFNEPLVVNATYGGIGVFNPYTHAFSETRLPYNHSAGAMVTGPYGNVWFNETSSVPGATVSTVSVAVIVGPKVLSVRRFGYHKQPTTLVLSFSAPLDPSTAENLSNYRLVAPGGRRIAIVSATYDPANVTVTLKPAQRLLVHGRYRLTVDGTAPYGVTDAFGSFLDGAATGHWGTNYSALITWRNLVF